VNKLPPTWQRLVLSIIGIILIELSWRWSVCHLYTLPAPALSGFVTITTNAFYVIGAIVVFMVTGKLIYEWKMGTSQIQNVSSSFESVSKEITKRVPKAKYYDDEQI